MKVLGVLMGDLCFTGQIARHGIPQKGVDTGLVAGTLGFEPGKDIGVEAEGNRFFERAVKLADDRFAPIGHFRDIRGIDILVAQGDEGSEFPVARFSAIGCTLAFRRGSLSAPR